MTTHSGAHTPGPWGVQSGSIYAAETDRVHDGRSCEEAGHDPTECGPAVFHVLDREILDDVKLGAWDEVESPKQEDLQLAAAAPELLAALEAEQEWRDREEAGELDPEWDYEFLVGNKRRAAITKARGETA